MPIFNVHQAKANLSKLLKVAERGEDVFIAQSRIGYPGPLIVTPVSGAAFLSRTIP